LFSNKLFGFDTVNLMMMNWGMTMMMSDLTTMKMMMMTTTTTE